MSKTPYIVGIGGPSGSGKSVFCKTVVASNDHVSRLKLDDFFCDEDVVERHPEGYACWDHPSSIKWGELVETVHRLKMGLSAEIPDYSRKTNRQEGTKIISPAEVILVDGYMVLWHNELRDLLDLKIYFDAEENTLIERRLERQPDVNKGYLYNVMLPVARQFIEPTRLLADHVVDARLPRDEVYKQGASIISRYFAKIKV